MSGLLLMVVQRKRSTSKGEVDREREGGARKGKTGEKMKQEGGRLGTHR